MAFKGIERENKGFILLTTENWDIIQAHHSKVQADGLCARNTYRAILAFPLGVHSTWKRF